MISQSAEYALRAVVCLAEDPDSRMSTTRIAEATKVPPGYLSKVLQALGRSGLVASVPGRIGGFRLSRSPAAMTVLDVVHAVDAVQRITTCPLGLRAHGKKLCPLHRRLDEAAAAVEKAFAATTIAELVRTPGSAHALCR